MNGKAALTALALLVLLPSASAITITPTADPAQIAADSATQVGFTVTGTCQEAAAALGDIAGAEGSWDIDVSLAYPDGLTGDDTVTVTLDPSECVTGAPATSISEDGSFSTTPTEAAPGMTVLNIVASADNADNTDIPVKVDYMPGYDFIVNATFPMEIPPEGLTFPAQVHLYANAESMAMWETLQSPEWVSIAGLPDFQTVQNDELAGSKEKRIDLTITVSPPSEGGWETDAIQFKTWSHYLQDGSQKSDDVIVDWSFVAAPGSEGGEENEESPGIGVPILLAGLAAAGVAARRRK